MKTTPDKIKELLKKKFSKKQTSLQPKNSNPRTHQTKLYSHNEAREAANSVASTTAKIWKILFCTLPIDIGAVFYFTDKMQPIYKEAPYNLYIYALLLGAMILPLMFDAIFTVFRTGKLASRDKLMQPVLWLTAAAIVVFFGIALFEEINISQLLGQTAVGLAVLSTLYPLLKGVLNIESQELSDRDSRFLTILCLTPCFLLRIAALLVGMQAILFEQDITNYLLKWAIIVLLSLVAYPNKEWFKNYFKLASEANRANEAKPSSKFSEHSGR